MADEVASSQRNPFERLPVEIFVSILHSALGIDSSEKFPSPGRTPHLQRLRLVARSWNSVIEITPAAWTLLDCSDPPSWILKSITRSAKSNLHIHYDEVTNKLHARTELYELVDLAINAIDRWQSFFLVYEDLLEFPDVIINHPAPNLEHIFIRYELDEDIVDEVLEEVDSWDDLFGGDTPRLLTMHLQFQLVRWNSQTFTSAHLQRLEIRSTIEINVKLTDFLVLLSGLPLLQHLTISDIAFLEGRRVDIVEKSVILNKLVKLEWTAAVRDMMEVLRAIQYPLSCDVAIRSYRELAEDPGAFSAILSSLAPKFNWLQGVHGERIVIAFGKQGPMTITTRSRSLYLEFLDGENLGPLTKMLQHHHDVFSTIPVSLIYDFASWKEIEANFKNLTQIATLLPTTSTLVFTSRDEDQILQALHTIFGAIEGSIELRQALPALQSVETPFCNEKSFYDNLVARFDMSQAREPISTSFVLRFPFEAVDEYPDVVNEFVTRYPWAEWHKGPSVVQEDFEDLLPKVVSGRLYDAHPPQHGGGKLCL